MILGHPEFSVQPTNALPQANSLFIHFQQGQILLKDNEFPTWEQISPFLPRDFEPFELAHAGEQTIFSSHPYAAFTFEANDRFHYEKIDIFRSMPPLTASLLTSSLHLWRWYENNRYCGRCSSHLTPDSHDRALRCPQCGHLLFPTISPAVIVAITCGNRILLARNIRYQHYALIAGYVEVGETLEHALRREVLEEVGLQIHNIRYLGDQPWGSSGSQMFAFHAEADDNAPIILQENELADARWFEREDVPLIPHKVSIAYDMMQRFRNGTL